MSDTLIVDTNDTKAKVVDTEGLGARKAVGEAVAAPLIEPKPDAVVVAEGVAAPPIETYMCPRCKFKWSTSNFSVSPMLKQATGRGFYCPQCYEGWIDSYVPIMRKQ